MVTVYDEKQSRSTNTRFDLQGPEGQRITAHCLAIVTARLNTRIRGLSAREIVFQRDGYTGDQLNIDDKSLAEKQRTTRTANHLPSAYSQATVKQKPRSCQVKVGDLL